MPNSQPSLTPSSVARARLMEVVGRGADSTVYRAVLDGRDYALKVANTAGVAIERRYRREAALYANFHHPAFPRVLEVGVHGGKAYLLSALIRGETLAARISAGPLSMDDVYRIALALTDAVGVLHKRGLVHRDLKPANVMLEESGEVRLIDFGLAGRLDAVSAQQGGTLLYASPEHMGMYNRPVDARSDLYGLGCVLYACVTGQPPFPLDDAAELLHAHAAIEATPLVRLRSDISDGFSAIVGRLLEKDPDARFPSSDVLRTALLALEESKHPREEDDTAPRLCVGRARELARLGLAWEQKTRRGGHVVAVTGPPGIGRSHLIEHFLADRIPSEAWRLSSTCTDDRVPFHALKATFDSLSAALAQATPAVRAARLVGIRTAAGGAASLIAMVSPALGAWLQTSGRAEPPEDPSVRVQSIAGFLVRLAADGGLAMALHRAERADEASLAAIRSATERCRDGRMLVLLELPAGEAHGSVLAAVGRSQSDVGVSPLRDGDIERILAARLHVERLSVAADIAARVNGNAMMAFEYLDCLYEEGNLVPHWGHWFVTPGALDRLVLPERIQDLLVARLARISPATRTVLSYAAVLGPTFSPELVGAVSLALSVGPEAVQRALEQALHAQLLVRADGGGLRFVHEEVREACVVVEPSELQAVHRAAAHWYDSLSAPSLVDQMACAAHHVAGADHRAAPAAACLAGGLASLSLGAFSTAYALLQRVLRSPVGILRAERAEADAAFATTCFRLHRMEEAATAFQSAIRSATTALGEARAWAGLARTHMFTFNTRAASEAIGRAFLALGVVLPSDEHPSPVALQARLTALLGEHIGVVQRGQGRGIAKGAEAERARVQIQLAEQAFLIGYYDRNPLFALQGGILGLLPAHALGTGPDAAMGFATMSMLLGLIGKSEPCRLFAGLALRLAEESGDPSCLANTKCTLGFARHFCGDADVALELQREVFSRWSDWLGPIAFQNCCIDLAWNWSLRGYHEEALRVSQEAIQRLGDTEDPFFAAYACRAMAAAMTDLARLGRVGEATDLCARVERMRQLVPADRTIPWVSVEGFLVGHYRELGDTGRGARDAHERHGRWNIPIERAALHSQHYYLWTALEAFDQASVMPTAAALAALGGAVDNLEILARSPVVKAHAAVLRASWHAAAGRLDDAWTLVGQADGIATRHDVPWARAMASLVRARMLTSEGRGDIALEEAALALQVASRGGWQSMVRRIIAEFPSLADRLPGRSDAREVSRSTAVTLQGRPQLHAWLTGLLALGRATATILDPAERARVALDETIRLLGAERACLFLADEQGVLRFSTGRSSAHADIPEPGAYSRTVIERAFTQRDAVLVATRGDAGALGSQSVLVHDLRSVVAAPLVDGTECLGTLYVENRLAHGVFSPDQVGLLSTLAAYISSALRTAQAARLASEISVERERRRIAEALGSFAADMNGANEEGVVLERLAYSLHSTLVYGQVAVVGMTLDGEVTTVHTIESALPPIEVDWLLSHSPDDADWQPVGIFAPDPQGRSWVAQALMDEDGVSAWVFLGTSEGQEPRTAEDLALASTLVHHAAVALQNARLFARLERMAIRDALTGLFNRGEFFRRAEQAVGLADACSRPLGAAMLDVDHFKRVNDVYGHATGDLVLRSVARAIQDNVRSEDVVGRYGGEEFGLLLPDVGADEALAICERIRAAVASLELISDEGEPLTVTISIGLATHQMGDGLAGLLHRADLALYASKHGGRNQATLSDEVFRGRSAS